MLPAVRLVLFRSKSFAVELCIAKDLICCFCTKINNSKWVHPLCSFLFVCVETFWHFCVWDSPLKCVHFEGSSMRYSLALWVCMAVDQFGWTTFNFIWFAHTLNYAGSLSGFLFVCILRCTLCGFWCACETVICGTWLLCRYCFSLILSLSLPLSLSIALLVVLSFMPSVFLWFHWPSESLLTEIKCVCSLHFPYKIQ